MKVIGERAVAIADIVVGPRLRKTDPDWVEALAVMIAEAGLIQPISVMVNGTRFTLAAGAHRLEAVQRLGWSEIDARIVEPETENIEAEIRFHEILENIGRRELSALDRAAHLAELKRVHETLFPLSRRGALGRAAARRNLTDKLSVRGEPAENQQKSSNEIFSFADSVAQKTGLHERSVFRAIAIYEGISPAVRDEIAGTWLADHQSQLTALSKLEADEQTGVLPLLIGEEATERNVHVAAAIVAGHQPYKLTADDQAAHRLNNAWLAAPAKVQRAFVEAQAHEIAKYLPVKFSMKRTGGSK